MAVGGPQSDSHASTMWRRCLASAFRTALACTIVGVTTLFGPKFITRHVAFPSFSYVTTILIVMDAALGDALRGCWLALGATMQGIGPAILLLWLIGPARLTAGTTAAAVAVSAFVVTLPENTHLIAKRIALGQIVIVYVVGYIKDAETDPIMHPVHVAASTALGAAACVLALVLPYPSLACNEVKKNCKVYIENASERLKLYIKAFTAEENTQPKGFISQANSLKRTSNKLLQNIKSKQGSMKWERIPVRFLKYYHDKNDPAQVLQGLETILTGMETALESCSEFPVQILQNNLLSLQEEILTQVNSITLGNSIHPHSQHTDSNDDISQTFYPRTLPILSCKDLPSLFFFFCLKNLQSKSDAVVSPDHPSKQVPHSAQEKNRGFWSMTWSNSTPALINKGRLMFALKCSLSLGFAVLFGLMYSKENGYWAGLPVAVTLASAREATFKVANIKAQGTVLGSIYGVIWCVVFEKYVKLRFISLLPWFIFCSFLRQSRMYGQAGGACAVIGAVLILGRKNFGAPSEFAMARIVETFIGLSCSIMVDVLLHPTRAAVLAKVQLATCLQALHESITLISLDSANKCSLEEGIKKLKFHTNELGKFIEEAEMEPNFWFLPLNSTCYHALKLSLTKSSDSLHFTNLALTHLKQDLDSKLETGTTTHLASELKSFKEAVCCEIKRLEEVLSVKSLVELEKEYEKRKNSADLEMGRSGKQLKMIQWGGVHDWDMKKIVQQQEVDGEVAVWLGALMWCINGLQEETKEMEKGVKELVQWENPSIKVDLNNMWKLHGLDN